MYHNDIPYIPFGQTTYQGKDGNYFYFRKELIDYLKLFESPVTVDLLTCNMNDPLFANEVDRLRTIFPNVSIEYSLGEMGGVANANWDMDSNDATVRDIYFNPNITAYNHVLGVSAHSAIILEDGTLGHLVIMVVVN
jgi:hypothetical protein